MRIVEFPIEFEYLGKAHRWVISYQETMWLPTVFQVTDERNFFAGQLIYYQGSDRWRFFYANKDNIQELADILANYVMLWYE